MLKKLGSKIFNKNEVNQSAEVVRCGGASMGTDEEVLRLIEEEFENIKENRVQIQGSDFDRAFEFIEKHPDNKRTKQLVEEMNKTNTYTLKGLSHRSAVSILEKMPDHLGAQSIINGMYNIDKDYFRHLISDVLVFILEVAPDHPHAEMLATSIANKNLTNAYNFINRNPSHPHTEFMIRAMFHRDPNISILLFMEKLDHPQVQSIFEAIYGISRIAVSKLTPNAIIFILEVAPDHHFIEELIVRLVEENYIKAFDFAVNHPEFPYLESLKKAIFKRKPDLEELGQI